MSTPRKSVPLVLLTVLACLHLPVAGWAAVVATVAERDGQAVIRLENARLELEITPARGGAVTAWSDKRAPGNIVLPNRFWGLCLDHFQEQIWPGELLEVPYEHEIVSQTPEEARVKVWRRATGEWRNQVNAKLAGLLLEKTYILRADSAALEVEVNITAPADEARLAAYWVQHVFVAGEDFSAAADRIFRPTTRGVRSNAHEDNGMYGEESWIRDFTAGWIARLDTVEKRGLATVADYNEISTLYTSARSGTSEIMFNTRFFPKGGSFTYRFLVAPVAGLDRVTHADENVLAGMKIETDNRGGGSLTFTVARVGQAVPALEMAVSVIPAAAPGEAPVDVGTVSLTDIGDEPQSAVLEMKNIPADPVVVRVTATGKNADGKAFSASFEDFHAGAYQWGDNITTDMRTPLYAAERPLQTLDIAKPEEIRLTPEHRGGGHVLFFQGLLDEEYQVVEAFQLSGQAWRNRPRLSVSHYEFHLAFLGTLSHFPYDYDELLANSCVILGGVGSSGLKPLGIEMLHDYLEAGGGMIVLGGYGAYGRSRLADSKLGAAFPFAFENNPNALAGPVERVIAPAGNLPVFAGMAARLDPGALSWWRHPVTLKEGAKPILFAGDQPVMAAWEYGPSKARIVAIAAAPMGAPTDGQTPFWHDPSWHLLLRDAIWWVQKQDRRFE